MEQSGIPGSVHISHETFVNLTGDYDVIDGNGHERDSYLKEKKVKTYLIHPKNASISEKNRKYENAKS